MDTRRRPDCDVAPPMLSTHTGAKSLNDASAEERRASAPRDALMDLLRCLALVRIVAWHLFAQTWLTWIAALPVMFFVLGTVSRPNSAGHLAFVQRRARRLLIPFWVYGLATAAFSVVAVMTGVGTRSTNVRLAQLWTWVVPLGDPVAMSWTGGWLSNHLWYLRAVLWLTVLMPVLRIAARNLRRSVGICILGVAVLELASAWHLPLLGRGQIHVLFGDALVYGFFAVLGLAYQSSRAFGSIRTRSLLALGSATGAAAFAAFVGVPTGGVNASYPLIAMVGVATLSFLSLVERPLRVVAGKSSVAALSRRVSRRSLTIYLWHPLCIIGATHVITGSNPLASASLALLTLMLIALAVFTIGWVEEFAASRRSESTSHRDSRRVAVGVFVTALAALSATQGSWVSAAAIRSMNSGTLVPDIPAPSSRQALSNAAFAPVTIPASKVGRPAAPTSDQTEAFSELQFASLLSFSEPPASNAHPVLTQPANTRSASPAKTRANTPTVLSRAVAVRNSRSQPTAATAAAKAPSITKLTTKPTTTSAEPATSTIAAPATTVAPPTPNQPVTLPADRLQRAFDAWRAQAQPTITSSIVSIRVGNTTWTARSADPGAESKYLATTPFRASSITKTFTAALVMRAVDRGLLRLDDQVASLTGVNPPAPPGLTVRQLLTHTSGLVDYRNAPGYDPAAPLTATEAVALSLRAPLNPGGTAQPNYANTNYLYLGLLLEQVEAKSYAQLVRELVVQVGLTNTRLDDAPQPGWIGFSSGGIVSTAGDLALWGQALLTPGKVLSAPTLATMTTIGDANVGLGVWPACPCSTDSQGVKRFTAIGHHTADGGVFFFPATGMTVVAMFEPTGHDTHARIVSLAAALDAALR